MNGEVIESAGTSGDSTLLRDAKYDSQSGGDGESAPLQEQDSEFRQVVKLLAGDERRAELMGSSSSSAEDNVHSNSDQMVVLHSEAAVPEGQESQRIENRFLQKIARAVRKYILCCFPYLE